MQTPYHLVGKQECYWVEVKLLKWVFFLGIHTSTMTELLHLLPRPNWFVRAFWIGLLSAPHLAKTKVNGKKLLVFNGTRKQRLWALRYNWLFKLLKFICKPSKPILTPPMMFRDAYGTSRQVLPINERV